MVGEQGLRDIHRAIFFTLDRDDPHLYELLFGTKPRAREAPRYVTPDYRVDPCEGLFGRDTRIQGTVDKTTLDDLALGPPARSLRAGKPEC